MNYEYYDNQIRTLGLEAVIKLSNSSVAIIGLTKGLAAEVLKNLILCGVQNLFLVIDKCVDESDLITDYYYNYDVLKEKLNIQIISSLQDIEEYDMLIVINKNKEDIINYNNICRGYDKKFISIQFSSENKYTGIIFIDDGSDKINDLPLQLSCNDEVTSVNSVLGSIVAFESIKLLTNIYTPTNSLLTWGDPSLNINKNKLLDAEILIIGSGAIGCELLKNLVFLNVKEITITDPAKVKKSCLSKEFLFSNDDIGKFKSECAVNAIKKMKANIKINYLVEKVCSESEHIFKPILNNKKLIVFIALNNVDTQRYIDNLCFNYNLPLFVLNIDNLKGSVYPIIPFVTETYSNTVNPPTEKSFPICVIKNFPNQIIHTIHWALEQFEVFAKGPKEFNKWMNDKTIDISKEIWLFGKKKDFVIWALDIFYEYFDYQINELLNANPESDTQFWSGEKVCPKPTKFNIDIHYDFIELTVKLLSECYQEEYNLSYDSLVGVLKDYKYSPIDKDYVYNLDSNTRIDNLISLYFDKDNDIIMKWIFTASNLRATNYSIKHEDYYTIKGIAGKIIPSISMTASVAAGLATNEMIKYLSNSDIDNKNQVFDLALNNFDSIKPNEAKTIEVAGKKFNSWYKFSENEDLTIEEFIDKYNKLFETNISMISLGSSLIYADFMDSDKSHKLSNIMNEYSGNVLTISCDDENIELPEIQINL